MEKWIQSAHPERVHATAHQKFTVENESRIQERYTQETDFTKEV